VSTYKPYIEGSFIKMYHCHYSIFVPCYIKNKSVIAYTIHTIKGFFYTVKIFPVAE